MKKPSKSGLMVGGIALAFALFPVFLIDSLIKIPFCLIQTGLVLLLYSILRKRKIQIPEVLVKLSAVPFRLVWDGILVGFGLFFIIANSAGVQLGLFQALLATLCGAFLVGYAFLSVTGIERKFSRLESVVFSFLFSFILVGVSTLIITRIASPFPSPALGALLLLLGVLSLVRHLRDPEEPAPRRPSFHNKIDLVAILLVVVFYLFYFLVAYPGSVLLGGTDISRHYANSLNLIREPGMYWEFGLTPYVLFHAFNGGRFVLSGAPSLLVFQSLPFFLNICQPLAIYCVASRYFEHSDDRIPATAMLLWVFFSNLAFVAFLQVKILFPDAIDYSLLSIASNKTFWGIYYASQPFAWFLPVSVAFCLFFMALVLVRMKALSKWQLGFSVALIFFSLYLTHLSEAIILAVVLAVFSMIPRDYGFRLEEALIAGVIGLVPASLIGYFIRSQLVALSPLIQALAPISVLLVALLWRKFLYEKVKTKWAKVTLTRQVLVSLSMGLIVFYFAGVVVWFADFNYNASLANDFGVVPWFLYMEMLGVLAIFAILSLPAVKEKEFKTPITLFGMVLIALVFFARVVSFVNLNLFFTNYWEKRFITFIFTFVTLVGTVSFVKIFDKKLRPQEGKGRNNPSRTIKATCLLSLVVTLGMTSTVLQFEYAELNSRDSEQQPTPSEFQALTVLKTFFNDDPTAFAVGFSPVTKNFIQFATPPYTAQYSTHYLTASGPELPLFVSAWHPQLSHPYIFVNSRDLLLLNRNPGNYFNTHQKGILPLLYENQDTWIYNQSRVSFPRVNSSLTLVIPHNRTLDPDQDALFAYDVLSNAYHEYQVKYDNDATAFSTEQIVLAFDPSLEHVQQGSFDPSSLLARVQQGAKAYVFNTNGLGYFGAQYLTSHASQVNASHVSTTVETQVNLTGGLAVPRLTPVNASIVNLASFVGDNGTSSYLVREKRGAGAIYYFNLWPVIRDLKVGQARDLYPVLGQLASPVSQMLPEFNFTRPVTIPATFRTFEATGEFQASCASIVIDPARVLDMLQITTQDGTTTTRTGVSRVEFRDYDHVSVTSPHAVFLGGKGLYFSPLLDNATISLAGSGARLRFVDAQGVHTTIQGITSVQFVDPYPLEMLLYDAWVRATGRSFFGTLYSGTYANHRVIINGQSEFHVFLTDYWTCLDHFKLTGDINQSPAAFEYDEGTSMGYLLGVVLIFAAMYLAYIFMKDIKGDQARTAPEEDPPQ